MLKLSRLSWKPLGFRYISVVAEEYAVSQARAVAASGAVCLRSCSTPDYRSICRTDQVHPRSTIRKPEVERQRMARQIERQASARTVGEYLICAGVYLLACDRRTEVRRTRDRQ